MKRSTLSHCVDIRYVHVETLKHLRNDVYTARSTCIYNIIHVATILAIE